MPSLLPTTPNLNPHALLTSLRNTLHTHPLLLLPTALTIALPPTLLALHALHTSYKSYLSLGPGGLPHNIIGWLASLLVLRPLALSYTDRLSVDDYPDASEASTWVRENLPQREGQRPATAGVVPQRQVAGLGGEEWGVRVEGVLRGEVGYWNARQKEGEGGKVLEVKKSRYERWHEALFVSEAVLRAEGRGKKRELPATARVARGEIAHVHGDRSVHLYLRPGDARVVIERGWGERHRLSRTWPWYLGGGQAKLGLGHTWILLYGVRNERELEVVTRLIRESVRWMLGEGEEEGAAPDLH